MMTVTTMNLTAERAAHPEVPQDGDGEDHREVGVDPDPAHRHQELQPGRQVPAAAAERRTREHHLVDAGLVAHHGERGEDRAADDVADDDDQDRLHEPEAEHDAERAEDPVDRRDVRARPDPELLPARGVPVGFGNLLNRVSVEPGFAPRDVLCHLRLLSLTVPGTWRGHAARDQRLRPARGQRAGSAGRARRARPPGRSHAERPRPPIPASLAVPCRQDDCQGKVGGFIPQVATSDKPVGGVLSQCDRRPPDKRADGVHLPAGWDLARAQIEAAGRQRSGNGRRRLARRTAPPASSSRAEAPDHAATAAGPAAASRAVPCAAMSRDGSE